MIRNRIIPARTSPTSHHSHHQYFKKISISHQLFEKPRLISFNRKFIKTLNKKGMSEYDVSTAGAYGILYSVLGIFTVLAIISAGYGSSFLPAKVQNLLVAKAAGDGKSVTVAKSVADGDDGFSGGMLSTDFFL
jgi:hypothetical protein